MKTVAYCMQMADAAAPAMAIVPVPPLPPAPMPPANAQSWDNVASLIIAIAHQGPHWGLVNTPNGIMKSDSACSAQRYMRNGLTANPDGEWRHNSRRAVRREEKRLEAVMRLRLMTCRLY